MNWLIISQIIANEGLPLAEAIFTKWNSGKLPTEADFAELRALALQTSVDRVKARLVSAGIPLDSEKAQEILRLASN